MEKNKIEQIIFTIIVIFSIWIWKNYQLIHEQENKIISLEDDNSRLEDQINECRDSLSDANDNIEEANSFIEEAQDYAWSSYDEMGEALENLSTVDTVN